MLFLLILIVWNSHRCLPTVTFLFPSQLVLKQSTHCFKKRCSHPVMDDVHIKICPFSRRGFTTAFNPLATLRQKDFERVGMSPPRSALWGASHTREKEGKGPRGRDQKKCCNEKIRGGTSGKNEMLAKWHRRAF